MASEGIALLVIVDDAYFGLQYEEGLLRESIFGRIAWEHPNILAIKIDGPTKEDFVWGFRLGFITFGSASLGPRSYDALVKKLMGLVRSSVSSSSAPAQNLILKSLDFPGVDEQKTGCRALLAARYARAKYYLAAHPLPRSLKALALQLGLLHEHRLRGPVGRSPAQEAPGREGHRHGLDPGSLSASRLFLRRGRGYRRALRRDRGLGRGNRGRPA